MYIAEKLRILLDQQFFNQNLLDQTKNGQNASMCRVEVVKFCSDFLDDLKVLECAQSFFMPHHRRVIGHSPCQEIESESSQMLLQSAS